VLAVYLHDLWLCSSVRCPSCRKRACIHNCTSREPVFAAGEEDMFSTATKQGPGGWGLPLNKIAIEI
jgi:hypothetical protein